MFLHGVNWGNSGWIEEGDVTNSTSYLPIALAGDNLVLGTVDNYVYNGNKFVASEELRAAVNTPGNWNNDAAELPPPASPLLVTLGASAAVSQASTDPDPTERNAKGWRQLSAPVTGVTVHDLAGINLVQGVPAGGAFPAEYASAADNMLTTYAPGTAGALGNGFVPPSGTDYTFASGEGFFWYLYDNDLTPASQGTDGTSQSYELSDFEFTATGQSPVSDLSRAFTDYLGAGNTTDSRFYMIGNPFALPLAVSGITSTPARQVELQIYNPANGSYVINPADTSVDFLAVWQGAFAEVATQGNATFTFDYQATDGGQTPTFYGRQAPTDGIAFRLDGTLDDGTTVADEAALIRFDAAATAGWDVFDASKMTPPNAARALVAPVLVRDGAPYRAAISALPAAATTVLLAFSATGAGTFTLSWTATLPEGFSGTLRDVVTGEVVDLAAGTHGFTSGVAEWADRFEVVVARGAVASESAPVAALSVGTVRPNPTAGRASLRVEAPQGETVTVRVYDVLGREVAVAFDGTVGAGGQDVSLSTSDLAPGAYVVRVVGATLAETRRFTVAR